MPDTYNENGSSMVPEYKSTISIIQIIVSVICCGGGLIGMILPIMSLVEGSKVKNYVQEGNIQAANESLEKANKWNKYGWIVIGICIALVAIFCIIYFVFLGSIISNSIY